VGDLYDLAIGFADPTNDGAVVMIGYCIATNGSFVVGTDIQDEQHLVQIASPSNVDRYQRYPKVSQGDWSGGERQLIFVNANQYYKSQCLDTSKPGHLSIVGSYTDVLLPNRPTYTNPRVIAADAVSTYVTTSVATEIYAIDNLTLAVTTLTPAASVQEIIRGGDAMYFETASAVYQMSDAHAFTEVTNDHPAVDTMAYFGGSIWYALSTAPRQLNGATFAFPGAGAAQLAPATTMPQMETAILSVCDSGQGLIIVTGDAVGGLVSFVYSFDGLNQTFLGAVKGLVIDSVNANGTVYLLASTGVGNTVNAQALPVIYEITGSTINTFDDYRSVDPAFYPGKQGRGAAYGHVATDGLYLYLFWFGQRTKRYLLSTGAIYDVGGTGRQPMFGAPNIQGGWIEGNDTSQSMTAIQPLLAATVNGFMEDSFFDFGMPTVDKKFDTIEFTRNTAIAPTALTVSFRTAITGSFTAISVQVSLSGDTLICYLPSRTIG